MEQNSLENEDIQTGSSSSLEGDVHSTGKIINQVGNKPTKESILKRLGRRMNVYLVFFIVLLLAAMGIVGAVYLTSKRDNQAKVQTQSLTQDTLKQLANNDVSVGQPKQILNVQSNAVFTGKVLIRDSLEVAGPIQVGGAINVPGITVSGNSIFENLQINKDLSVNGNTSVQGQMNIQRNLTVAGSANFGGPVSAPQLNVNTLQLNGNLVLTRHIATGGATPGRSNGDALGSGGTAAVSGSDIAGSINVNTGSGAHPGCFVTVNFSQRYNSTPHVNVTPIGHGAAVSNYYVNRSANNFSVCAAATPPSNASFGFDYFVTE